MSDTPRGPAKWLTAVAAVIFVVFLWEYTGSWVAVALVTASIGGLVLFEAYRSSRSRFAPAPRCLKCGTTMKATARSCPDCGSASWTN